MLDQKNCLQALPQFHLFQDNSSDQANEFVIEDIIEEIVGELVDEFDDAENSFYRINQNNMIVDAKVSISDLNDEIGSSIELNGYDTIGGLVYK